MNAASLFFGLLFGSVGFGIFVYGRKQQQTTAAVCGLALMVLPYVVTSSILLFVTGAVLTALPFVYRS